VVTLTGHVSNYLEKLAVESAVRRVKGVRAMRGGQKKQGFCFAWSVTSVMSVIEYLYP
jgi:hypothetical protein